MKIINFVSTFEHYDDEEKGIKPYTIRMKTDRLIGLVKGATHVRVQRAYTKTSFIRQITHRLDWEGYIIFAWNPNNKMVGV